jgi:DNA polymerase V
MSFSSVSENELADTITIGEYLIGHKESSYLLEIEGSSMDEVGIKNGDKVIFERGRVPRSGDIVISLTDDGYKIDYLNKIKSSEQVIGVVTSSFRTYGKNNTSF